MKIPVYESQATIPGQTGQRRRDLRPVGVADTSLVPRAIGGLGKEIGNIANLLADRAEKLRKQDEANYAFESLATFGEELMPFIAEEKAKTGKATYGNVERMQDTFSELIQSKIDNAPSEEVGDYIRKQAYLSIQGDLKYLTALQVAGRKLETTSTLDKLGEAGRKSVYQNPSNLNSALGLYHDVIDRDVGLGMLGEIEAEAKETQANNNLIGAAIDGLIDSKQFTFAGKTLKDFSSMLLQSQTDYYHDKIETGIKANEAEQIRLEEKAKKLQREAGEEVLGNLETEWAKLYYDDELSLPYVLSSARKARGAFPNKVAKLIEHWSDKVRQRTEDLKKEKDPFLEQDEFVVAELSRKLDSKKGVEEITKKGGASYLRDFVGKGKDGGLKTTTADGFIAKYQDAIKPDKEDDPDVWRRGITKQDADNLYKDWFFTADVDPGTPIKDVGRDKILENRKGYADYMSFLDAVMKKYPNEPDKWDEAGEKYLKPLIETKVESWLEILPWETIGLGGIIAKEFIKDTDTMEEIAKKQDAIRYLILNDRVVDEETIKKTVEWMNLNK